MRRAMWIGLHIVACVGICCADIITKVWAVHADLDICHLIPGVSCILTYNPGIICGITTSFAWIRYAIVMVQTGITLAAFWYGVQRACYGEYAWEYVAISAGGAGNLVSRVIYDNVIDFIVIGAGAYTWPAFNIADIAIVGGVCMLMLKPYKGVRYA